MNKTKFDLGIERVINWPAVRMALIDELKRKKVKYRGSLPVSYLQAIWHNRQSNKAIKEIINDLLGQSLEDQYHE